MQMEPRIRGFVDRPIRYAGSMQRGNGCLLAVLLAGTACGGEARSARHVPTPSYDLMPPPQCALYRGAASGNDDAMDMKLALCPAAEGMVGWVELSSRSSGWSLRDVVGAVGPDGRLTLKDVRFVESYPSDEWEFCLVDRYELHQVDAASVEGSYDSRSCDDRATLSLRRVQ